MGTLTNTSDRQGSPLPPSLTSQGRLDVQVKLTSGDWCTAVDTFAKWDEEFTLRLDPFTGDRSHDREEGAPGWIGRTHPSLRLDKAVSIEGTDSYTTKHGNRRPCSTYFNPIKICGLFLCVSFYFSVLSFSG